MRRKEIVFEREGGNWLLHVNVQDGTVALWLTNGEDPVGECVTFDMEDAYMVIEAIQELIWEEDEPSLQAEEQ
jgi:hypothetical protein